VLSAGKVSMIALGGAIGTGLFLGAGFAINLAGPAVVLSYSFGAVIALLLASCLAEMASAHPGPGSFGSYAEIYLGPLAGFLVRYTYWCANVLAIGTEVAGISLYMQYWFPGSPGWAWSAGLSAILLFVNSISVDAFGTLEYGLSTLKITVIVLFILICGSFLFGSSASLSLGVRNYTDFGGLLPRGWWGAWTAVVLAMFGFMGTEMAAVASGEAQDPRAAVKLALRSTVMRLILFYLLTLVMMLATVPWPALSSGSSAFVVVMHALHVPLAAGLINCTLLIAALSAINSQLYMATRMLFSLARAGLGPESFGMLSPRGVPLNALVASSFGIVLATALGIGAPNSAYVVMVAVSIFGGLFTWIMIFLTHCAFKTLRSDASRMGPGPSLPVFPAMSVLGLACTLAILATTFFMPPFRLTLICGIPFILTLVIAYFVRYSPK
jgi:L-asparagine transporter-like permease